MPKYEMEDIIVDEIDVTQQNYLKSGRYVKIENNSWDRKHKLKVKGLEMSSKIYMTKFLDFITI